MAALGHGRATEVHRAAVAHAGGCPCRECHPGFVERPVVVRWRGVSPAGRRMRTSRTSMSGFLRGRRGVFACPGGQCRKCGDGSALAMPADYGLRFDDHQARAPARPEPGQPDPEDPAAFPQPRPLRRHLEDGELPAERQGSQRPELPGGVKNTRKRTRNTRIAPIGPPPLGSVRRKRSRSDAKRGNAQLLTRQHGRILRQRQPAEVTGTRGQWQAGAVSHKYANIS